MEQYCTVVLHLFKGKQKSIQKLEARIQYFQYKDITGCIRWLENVLFDNDMNMDGKWTRMYKKYDYMADWDAWVKDLVRLDITVSTSSGETSSDYSSDPSTSDNDTDNSAPPPNQTALGKRKRTQARAEAR